MTTFKSQKKLNITFTLTLTDLSIGKVISLTRALCYYNSPVGNDVLRMIRNAIYNSDKTVYAEIESSLAELMQKMNDKKC